MAARSWIAFVLLLSAGPALAADSWDKMLCMAGGGAPSANVMHCTAVLNDGRFESSEEHARILFKRGTAQIETGAYAKAVADFDEAIRLRPEFGEAFHNRAVAKWRKGDLKGALADFDESVTLGQVELWRAYKVRGDLKAEMGLLDEALADYKRSLAIRPDWDYTLKAIRRLTVKKQGN